MAPRVDRTPEAPPVTLDPPADAPVLDNGGPSHASPPSAANVPPGQNAGPSGPEDASPVSTEQTMRAADPLASNGNCSQPQRSLDLAAPPAHEEPKPVPASAPAWPWHELCDEDTKMDEVVAWLDKEERARDEGRGAPLIPRGVLAFIQLQKNDGLWKFRLNPAVIAGQGKLSNGIKNIPKFMRALISFYQTSPDHFPSDLVDMPPPAKRSRTSSTTYPTTLRTTMPHLDAMGPLFLPHMSYSAGGQDLLTPLPMLHPLDAFNLTAAMPSSIPAGAQNLLPIPRMTDSAWPSATLGNPGQPRAALGNPGHADGQALQTRSISTGSTLPDAAGGMQGASEWAKLPSETILPSAAVLMALDGSGTAINQLLRAQWSQAVCELPILAREAASHFEEAVERINFVVNNEKWTPAQRMTELKRQLTVISAHPMLEGLQAYLLHFLKLQPSLEHVQASPTGPIDLPSAFAHFKDLAEFVDKAVAAAGPDTVYLQESDEYFTVELESLERKRKVSNSEDLRDQLTADIAEVQHRLGRNQLLAGKLKEIQQGDMVKYAVSTLRMLAELHRDVCSPTAFTISQLFSMELSSLQQWSAAAGRPEGMGAAAEGAVGAGPSDSSGTAPGGQAPPEQVPAPRGIMSFFKPSFFKPQE